jgi:hypothetical protein
VSSAGPENEEAAMFVQWLEQGVFDALSRKYLATVLLEIYEELPSPARAHGRSPLARPAETQKADSDATGTDAKLLRRMLEVFSFSVEYPGDSSGPRLAVSADPKTGTRVGPWANFSRDAIKKSTSDVLRELVVLASTLDPLPKNRVISVKLLYTSATPEDYEPPMFRAAGEQSTGCWFENRPLRMSPGKVRTPYHEMVIRIRTALDATDPHHDDGLVAAQEAHHSPHGAHAKGDQEARAGQVDANEDAVGATAGAGADGDEDEAVVDGGSDVVNVCASPTQFVDVGGSTARVQPQPSRSRLEDTFQGNQQPPLRSVDETALGVDGLTLGQQPGAAVHAARSRLLSPPSAACRTTPGAPAAVSPFPGDFSAPASTNPTGGGEGRDVGAARPTSSTVGRKRPPLPRRPPTVGDGNDSQAPSHLARTSRRKVSETDHPIRQRPKRARRGVPHQHRPGLARGLAENVSSCL